MSYITLSEAKAHCLVDKDFVEDDSYFLHLIDVAENSVSKAINKPLYDCVEDGELPPSVKQSVLLVIGSMYSNRESIAPVQMHKLPHSLDWLLGLDRHYHIM